MYVGYLLPGVQVLRVVGREGLEKHGGRGGERAGGKEEWGSGEGAVEEE